MQGFIEVVGLPDRQASNIKRAQEQGEQPDLSMLNQKRNLIAISSIVAVAETEIPGLLRVVLPGATFSYALGTVADIAAKIAAAQDAPTHRDPALFDGPYIRVSGWGGTALIRLCDITGIISVSDSKTKCIIRTRVASVESLMDADTVERLIGEARSAWYGKGAA